MREFKIGANDAGQRLDRFVGKYLERAPKSLIQKYIRKKRVKLNKKRAYPEDLVSEGDIINIYLYEEELNKYRSKKSFKIYDQGLNYIYEDENIAVANKPAGKIMYGEGGSMIDLLISDLIKKGEFDPDHERTFAPSFANRLDRNTAGLLVACKNALALRLVNQAFSERKIEKRYRCLVNGRLAEEKRVEIKLKEVSGNMVLASEDGRDTLSIFYPLKVGQAYSLIEADLVTGRKHQLRVHLAEIGHPILGDKKYGRGEDLSNFNEYGQYLISSKLIFKHMTGELAYLSNMAFEINKSCINTRLENYFLSMEGRN